MASRHKLRELLWTAIQCESICGKGVEDRQQRSCRIMFNEKAINFKENWKGRFGEVWPTVSLWWVAWTSSRFLFIPSHFGYQQKNEIFWLVWKLGYHRIYSVETAKQGHKRCCICDRYSPEKQVCWGVIRFIDLELILLLILFISCHTYLKLFMLNYRTLFYYLRSICIC